MPQAQQNVVGHGIGELRIEDGGHQRDGHMILPDVLRFAGGGGDGAGRAGLDTGAAADALVDKAKGSSGGADADGLGRADLQAGGA